jgi:hypothetical protein
MVITQTYEQLVESTNHLSVNELADFVDHLGDGTLEDAKKESWYNHVAHLLSDDIDRDTIYDLWVVMIDIHSDRFEESMKRKNKS